MKNIFVTIDGKNLIGHEDDTILQLASQNGIFIPTLCNDERVKPSGACGICVVEVLGNPRLLRACGTKIADGMVVSTNSENVLASRKATLELLLSDHTGDCQAPCLTACPAETDCQGYVGLIANGEYEEAIKLIKEKIPLPACIGRVCPHPCEKACRRGLVEQPISIAALKYFAADKDLLKDKPFVPQVKAAKGKSVGVVGGGPGGLSAAYFLKIEGHDVTVYDGMEKMGGMLRYGIPEYRLPRNIIDKEVSIIEKMGVKLVNSVTVGRDVSFDELRAKHDALVVAIGAWKSSLLRCKGEELFGVFGGIDFLRKVSTGEHVKIGKKVAIVGGGNTAMDACRTAVRLGAEEVYNIYRRTKAEMPAEQIEIKEAEEEGVIFKYLVNPIEIVGEDGKAVKVRLQKMKLGEADSSGRRSAVPIEGEEEVLDVDTVIVAIGQGVLASGFEQLELTRYGTICADENTFQTNIDGVFAIGDATNKGADIAITAIGEAKKVAAIICSYLNGEVIPYKKPYIVTSEVTEEMLLHKEKISRQQMLHRLPLERKGNFCEVNHGFTDEQAQKEASRCLECGCGDYFECKLVNYANMYNVTPENYLGAVHKNQVDDSSHFLTRNPEKCILCGLCVRVCDEAMGVTALGLYQRGFDTVVVPEANLPLAQTSCISCGQCATVCPTGAIMEKLKVEKPVPVDEVVTFGVCSFCSVGCETKITSKGSMNLRTLPNDIIDKRAVLCAKGRFGYSELQGYERIVKPRIFENDSFKEVSIKEASLKEVSLNEASFEKAFTYIYNRVEEIVAKYGRSSLAVSISDSLKNEEAYAIVNLAKNVLKTENVTCFNLYESGISKVLGNGNTTFYRLEKADVIVLVQDDDIMQSHAVAGLKIKQAVENGAKLVVIGNKKSKAGNWASYKLETENDLDVLKQFAKAVIDLGKTADLTGLDDLTNYLATVTVSESVLEAAKAYAEAENTIIVFDEKALTQDAAMLVADIAAISGHLQTGKKNSGIIPLKPNCNTLGLQHITQALPMKERAQIERGIAEGKIKALFVFGEDIPDVNLSNLDLLVVSDCIVTETTKKADVVLPLAAAYETSGTYTSTDGEKRHSSSAIKPLCQMTNVELVTKLSQRLDKSFKAFSVLDFAVFYESTQINLQVPKSEPLYTNSKNTASVHAKFVKNL